MESVDANQKEESLNHTEESTYMTSADHLVSMNSSHTDNTFEEPHPLPRLGDQYQAEIPPLMTESECIQLRLCDDYVMRKELAIPVFWVQQVDNQMKHEQELHGTTVHADTTQFRDSIYYKRNCFNNVTGYLFEGSGKYRTSPGGSTCKVELPDHPLEHGKESALSGGSKCANFLDHFNADFPSLQQKEGKCFSPLPGSSTISWSKAEIQSFVLGLYIFRKNLVQIRKFMEGKKMGDILSFYYGKFYRSDSYRRWSECRKTRSRRCIHGQRIFTGWRLRELLSRLLPGISKEVQDTLFEATRTFSQGRNSLEEYVFSLKASIGMEKLVEAVGIGKGKHDLTGIVMDPVRANHVLPMRPVIPIGKDCSALTSREIIKFLTGDFRLSKAKSNDLFWEAVWPRLLANGWHSEQPADLACVGSKNSLIFLVPGINKFSRKRLVKGDHYFDSVSDVLRKVASDPGLLDIEIGGANINNSTKEGMDNIKLDQNGAFDHQRRYLRPKPGNVNSEVMKFTVVDTSLFHGETPFKLRELRSLPANANYSYSPSNSSSTSSDSSEKQLDSTCIPLNQQESHPGLSSSTNSTKGVQSGLSVSLKRIPVSGHDPEGSCHDILDDKHPIYDIKSQHNHDVKSVELNSVAPAPKRQRLSACKLAESSHHTVCFSKAIELKKDESQRDWRSLNASESKDAECGPSQGQRFSNLFPISDLDESVNFIRTTTSSEAAMPQGKETPQPLFFDPNLQHISPNIGTNEPIHSEMAGNQGSLGSKDASFSSGRQKHIDNFQAFRTPEDVPTLERPAMNSLRQSTRSRPLTTKALEAFECGLFTAKRKGRGTESHQLNNVKSRSSRRARTARVAVPYPMDVGVSSSNTLFSNVGIQEKYDGYIDNTGTQEVHGSYTEHTNHARIFDESLIRPDIKESQ